MLRSVRQVHCLSTSYWACHTAVLCRPGLVRFPTTRPSPLVPSPTQRPPGPEPRPHTPGSAKPPINQPSTPPASAPNFKKPQNHHPLPTKQGIDCKFWLRVLGVVGVLVAPVLPVGYYYTQTEDNLRKARIKKFSRKLQDKSFLVGTTATRRLPVFKDLLPEIDPEYEDFSKSDHSLVVEGPPGIGKTTKLLDLLATESAPVFFLSFLGANGSSSNVVFGLHTNNKG